MCECKNTLWTFIFTPTGILPSREFYQGYICVKPVKQTLINVWSIYKISC